MAASGKAAGSKAAAGKDTGGKAATAKPAKAASTGKTDGAHKTVQPSPELSEVIGSDPLKRTEVVSKVWDYIKKNDLQNPENRREIVADDKLEKVFGRPKVTMFEMNKYLNQHLK